MRCALDQGKSLSAEKSGNIIIHNLTMLPLSKNHESAPKNGISIAYLQFSFDEIHKDYLTQTVTFLAGVELKKINSCLRRLN